VPPTLADIASSLSSIQYQMSSLTEMVLHQSTEIAMLRQSVSDQENVLKEICAMLPEMKSAGEQPTPGEDPEPDKATSSEPTAPHGKRCRSESSPPTAKRIIKLEVVVSGAPLPIDGAGNELARNLEFVVVDDRFPPTIAELSETVVYLLGTMGIHVLSDSVQVSLPNCDDILDRSNSAGDTPVFQVWCQAFSITAKGAEV
jgi:hypothetical protein